MLFDMGEQIINMKEKDMFSLINEKWLVMTDQFSQFPN